MEDNEKVPLVHSKLNMVWDLVNALNVDRKKVKEEIDLILSKLNS